MAIGTPSVLTQGGSTTDGTEFITGSAVAPTGGTLVLLISVASAGTSPDVTPTITGHGTWTLANSAVDIPMAGRIFTAPAAGTSGTLTITFPSTVEACTWHLVHIPGANNTVAQVGNYGGNAQSPTWNLPAAPAATSATIFLGAINGASATISPDLGAVDIGVEEDQSAPSLSSKAMWASPATQTVGFTSSAAAVRKVGISLELTEAAAAPVGSADYEVVSNTGGVVTFYEIVSSISGTVTQHELVGTTTVSAGFGNSFGSTFGE